MPDFFFQIKAQSGQKNEWDKWVWPPVFSGKVTADDKKAARAQVDELYGQKFPMRVLAKDIDSAKFLLNLEEISEKNTRMAQLFEILSCKQCSAGFRVIDHYNNDHQGYKGRDFCSDDCRDEYKKEHDAELFTSTMNGKHPPVIYAIKNTVTGLMYVGQTTQAFTLRWWQHFFHGTDTKFHQAIKEHPMTAWEFKILEVIHMTEKPDDKSAADYICAREQFYIELHDTILNGYNTATSRKIVEPGALLEMM